MHRRPLTLLFVTATAGMSLLLAGQSATGSPVSFETVPTGQARVVDLGGQDRVQLTPVGDTGRTTLTPLPGPDGATPGLVVTSSGTETTVQSTSAATPTVVAGRAVRPAAASADDLVELHFDAIARDGRDGLAHVNVFDLETGAVSTRQLNSDSSSECSTTSYAQSDCILVPPGAYSVMAFVTTMPAAEPSLDSGRTAENVALVGDPEVHLTAGRDFTFDARSARPVTVATPGNDTKVNAQGAMQVGYRRSALNGKAFTATMRPSFLLDNTFYMQPTTQVSNGELETVTRLRLEAPDITLSAPGGLELHPEYYDSVWFSDFASEFPMYDGQAQLRAVDVGHATAADLAGKRLDGAIAVAERSDQLSVAEQSNAAAAAGAALVVIYNDGPGDNDDPNGMGVRLQVPTIRLNHAEGVALTKLPRKARVGVNGQPASPYLYDLVIKEDGRIPAQLHYKYAKTDLATQVREIHGQPSIDSTFSEASYHYQPGDTFAISTLFPFREGPRARTEYRIPDPDTRWTYSTSTPESAYNALFPHKPVLEMGLSTPRITAYAAKQRDVLPVAIAPIAPAPNPVVPIQRAGDQMRLQIEGFTDAAGNHGLAYSTDSGMSTHLEIRADGAVVGETDNLPAGIVQLPAGDSRVEVAFRSDNPQDWTQLSTHTDTTWSFPSTSTPAGQPVTQPVIVPDFDVPLDLRNRAHAASGRVGFDLALAHADGSAAAIDDVRLQASYDDGATWQAATVQRTSAGWHVVLPGGSGFVSLRLHAADTAGSAIDQTIIRAFDVAGR